jgi:two-component system CheB/CheR fusion protein
MSELSTDSTDQLDPAATDIAGEASRDGARKRRDPREPVAVVGIGASAGGIAPLQQFFGEMNPESGLAFVVVMHLSPDFESQLAAVIQQKTAMPVVQVTEAVKVQPNHVYVIPPNHQLTFEDSMLQLQPPQLALGRRVTIDLFFRSLAHAYGQRAVSIIMSGTDSDGVIGLKHVRAQGGVTIAQEPEEAGFDSMPLSAIHTGMVDWVMRVADIPRRLLEFVRNEHAMQLPPEIEDAPAADVKVKNAPGGETVSDETRDPDDEEALLLVLKHVRLHTGHDFDHYKRATVLRRIARRMQVNSVDSIPRYLEFLRQHPAEASALLHDLLISVTHFFRDQASFAALQANIPQLFAGKKPSDNLRVWVTGCATGEEAYSITMLLCEHAEKLGDPPSLEVFATDIDEQAINQAREGLYPATIEADVSPERLRQFFLRDTGQYRVRKEIRDKVLFARHNVLSDPAFSRVDLVTCRNLLIYLNREAQRRVFDIFHFALRPGGLLFIGGAESADSSHSLFSALDNHHRIYVRRSIPRPTWNIPTLPARAATPDRRRGAPDRPMLPGMPSAGVEEASERSQTSSYEGQGRRSVLFGELHLKLLEEYGPPSVVVNETYDIVHLSENAGRYLAFRAGEPSTNLMTVVNPALRVELRTALFRAAQSKESVIVPAQRVPIGSETEMMNLHVRPIRPSDSAHGFFLVLFEKKTEPLTEAEQSTEREAISREVGDELQSLKEQLNATVEQFEVSSEELKASNEELQAMNEELRSASEELETSKEELQSVNEELTTVNHELKDKIEELSRTNSDLNNLIASTDLATIFVDRHLCIQRFTPRVRDLFNILPADIGRPISDITHKLRYESLVTDAGQVLEKLKVIEHEVPSEEGSWFLTRIAPYRTIDDHINGVVLTLVDITARKRAEEERREGDARLRRAIEIETVGIIFLNSEGTITDANKAFLNMSGYTAEDVANGLLSWATMTPPEFHDVSRRAIEELKTMGRSTPYEKQYICKDGSRFWALFATKRIGDNGEAVKFVIDMTEFRKTQEALGQSEERFRQFAENSADVLWIIDAKTLRLEYLSPAYERIWGDPREVVLANLERWRELIHPDDRGKTVASLERILAGEAIPRDYRIIRPNDGEIRWIRDVGFPIRDETGKTVRVAGIAQDITEDYKRAAALQQSEERFRLLVEGAPDYAMFLLDTENKITYWSAGAEKVFGWTPEEAVGQKGDIIFIAEDKAKGEVEKELGTAVEKGRAPDRRWHKRKDGSRLWADGIMRRIDRADGSQRGFAKICRDATDQRAIDDALRHAKDEMEQRVLERTRDLLATNKELEHTMAQRQQLEKELLEISEREKRRIGEDLHDMVCQELTATALFLKSSGNNAADPKTARTLNEAAQIVNRNVGVARDLARGFQPVMIGSGGLTGALRSLCSQVKASKKMVCHLKLPRAIRISDQTLALTIFRIAQEAVTNAVKHSNATEITVCIEREGGSVRLVVEDNGKGFRIPKKSGKGLGLHIMKYRASVHGGKLKIAPKRDGGTLVVAEIPVKK